MTSLESLPSLAFQALGLVMAVDSREGLEYRSASE